MLLQTNVTAFLLLVVTCLATVAHGHMRMQTPYPRGAPDNPAETNKDYNLIAPMSSQGSPNAVPCKGKPAGAVVATYQAGVSREPTLPR